jgi:alpha-D-xyloside xylohydrolase
MGADYIMIKCVKKTNSLFCSSDYDTIEIEPWGRNSLRVRCTQSSEIKQDWINALINQGDYQADIEIHVNGASVQNGEIKANITSKGELSFIKYY